jgi:hypothetical protein
LQVTPQVYNAVKHVVSEASQLLGSFVARYMRCRNHVTFVCLQCLPMRGIPTCKQRAQNQTEGNRGDKPHRETFKNRQHHSDTLSRLSSHF